MFGGGSAAIIGAPSAAEIATIHSSSACYQPRRTSGNDFACAGEPLKFALETKGLPLGLDHAFGISSRRNLKATSVVQPSDTAPTRCVVRLRSPRMVQDGYLLDSGDDVGSWAPRNLAEFFRLSQAGRRVRCPRCGHDKTSVRTVLLQCASCGHQASATAGTIFQDTRRSRSRVGFEQRGGSPPEERGESLGLQLGPGQLQDGLDLVAQASARYGAART